MALSEEKLSFTIGLADVAQRAGVTVRTVLRHFGSRDGLFEALISFAREQVIQERETPVGDTARATHTIVGHYELRGDLVMRMLEAETVDGRIPFGYPSSVMISEAFKVKRGLIHHVEAVGTVFPYGVSTGW